jgi:hypothetical protein
MRRFYLIPSLCFRAVGLGWKSEPPAAGRSRRSRPLNLAAIVAHEDTEHTVILSDRHASSGGPLATDRYRR